jgi:hypothetical protein
MLPPGNWELLSIDPSSDTYTYFDYDEATDETRTFTLQPSQLDILDDNKRFVSMDDKGYKKDKDFWCAATIPNSIIHKWLVEDGVNVYDDNDWPAVKRKLNSNEYRYLRRGHFNI